MRKTQRKLNMYSELMFCYALNENKAEGEKMQGLIEKRMANEGISILEVLSSADCLPTLTFSDELSALQAV